MPFTAAHPAAVLPLRSLSPHLPFSALVIGAMAPDFEYFLPAPVSGHGHTIAGILVDCLPLGLLAWLFFHVLLKVPLANLLPERERRVLWPLAVRSVEISPRSLLRVLSALAVGAATHVAWDSFTHGGRWGTEMFPVLNRTVASLQGYDVTIYSLLQYGGTVVGMSLLALAYLDWRRRQLPVEELPPPLSPAWKVLFLSLLVLLPLGTATVWAAASVGTVSDVRDLRSFLWFFVRYAGNVGWICLLFFAAAMGRVGKAYPRVREVAQ